MSDSVIKSAFDKDVISIHNVDLVSLSLILVSLNNLCCYLHDVLVSNKELCHDVVKNTLEQNIKEKKNLQHVIEH